MRAKWKSPDRLRAIPDDLSIRLDLSARSLPLALPLAGFCHLADVKSACMTRRLMSLFQTKRKKEKRSVKMI